MRSFCSLVRLGFGVSIIRLYPCQFQDLRLERGIHGQTFSVRVTFLAIPRTEEATCLTKDGRPRRHIPDLHLGVKINLGASSGDHVIAVGIAPAAPEETFLVQIFK